MYTLSPQPSIFPSDGVACTTTRTPRCAQPADPRTVRSVAPWQVALLVGCKHVACTLTTSSFSSLVPILQQPARDTEAVLSHAQHKHAASPPHLLAHTPLGVCCVARAAASYFPEKVRPQRSHLPPQPRSSSHSGRAQICDAMYAMPDEHFKPGPNQSRSRKWPASHCLTKSWE